MRFAALLCICCLALAACGGSTDPSAAPEGVEHEVIITLDDGAEVALAVRVADSEEERARGLMGVETLAADEGMAFVFDEPSGGGFWMKDTLIPLSIAFVDDAGSIVTIRDMQPCPGPPCPSYGSDEPYVLAVEANAGWFDRNGVAEGDRARLRETVDG